MNKRLSVGNGEASKPPLNPLCINPPQTCQGGDGNPRKPPRQIGVGGARRWQGTADDITSPGRRMIYLRPQNYFHGIDARATPLPPTSRSINCQPAAAGRHRKKNTSRDPSTADQTWGTLLMSGAYGKIKKILQGLRGQKFCIELNCLGWKIVANPRG